MAPALEFKPLRWSYVLLSNSFLSPPEKWHKAMCMYAFSQADCKGVRNTHTRVLFCPCHVGKVGWVCMSVVNAFRSILFSILRLPCWFPMCSYFVWIDPVFSFLTFFCCVMSCFLQSVSTSSSVCNCLRVLCFWSLPTILMCALLDWCILLPLHCEFSFQTFQQLLSLRTFSCQNHFTTVWWMNFCDYLQSQCRCLRPIHAPSRFSCAVTFVLRYHPQTTFRVLHGDMGSVSKALSSLRQKLVNQLTELQEEVLAFLKGLTKVLRFFQSASLEGNFPLFSLWWFPVFCGKVSFLFPGPSSIGFACIDSCIGAWMPSSLVDTVALWMEFLFYSLLSLVFPICGALSQPLIFLLSNELSWGNY